jgi:hypothetical protein
LDIPRPPPSSPYDVLISVCDHYEPGNGGAANDLADQRVANWVEKYPRLFGAFKDSDGRPPRHSFFYPIEMYRPAELDALAGLCRDGFGEVEVHLHHHNDNAANLRKTILDWKDLLPARHGLLSRHRHTGETKYAFIHGNWCLNNSRSDGRYCGVDHELDVLYETGCYADFTFPSYPDLAQAAKINSIYYASDNGHLNHQSGIDVGTAPPPKRPMMLLQGPLVPNGKSRKFGLIPRVENGNLQIHLPPTMARLNLWLQPRIGVPTRPDWIFVKLYTHGATEFNQPVVLGEPMVRFHEALAQRAASDANFRYHYVTAREMYNLARAAEAGWAGSVNDARDYEMVWPR